MSTLLDKSSISSEDLEKLLQERTEGKADFLLVDVREDMEYKMGHIEGVDLLKPTSTFQSWAEPLLEEAKDKIVIFTCRTDYRSGQVQTAFKRAGHPRVINHAGGIVSYRGKVSRG
ncbi:MAG TPA: rhodanese-like domain-containing protein [Epsilonproteobacteria bacterium]|nr:rhodanese-like domain-containing protein [Campylobacterota bacterium]HHH37295.1 rhodanese-like domain-containing protein [Campylobacterota bacterium]